MCVCFPEARYRAAVLFPWDPALMSFYELYSLDGPVVFLPEPAWAFKVQQLTGWIWSQPIGAVELVGARRPAGASSEEESGGSTGAAMRGVGRGGGSASSSKSRSMRMR